MDKKIKKKYIKRLKEKIERSKGDKEVIHGEYDELLKDLIKEIGYGKLMDKLEEMISGIDFWCSYSDEHYKSITLEKPPATTANLRYADLKPASFKDLKD